MKRYVAILMAIVLVLSFVACGSSNQGEEITKETPSKETAKTEEVAKESAPVQVDEGLLSVDVTVGAFVFEDMTEDEIKAIAENKGFSNYKINADGSVTFTMTKAQQKAMLKELSVSFDEAMQEMVDGDEEVASFLSIEHSDDFSEVDVYIDPNAYTLWDSFYALAFYSTGVFYQSFAGVPGDEIDVVVSFIDNNTKEVIETASYKAYMENSFGDEGVSTEEPEKAVAAPTSFESFIAVDNSECSIAITEIDPDNMWGYTLKALFENKSAEKTYLFNVKEAYINGVECDPFFAKEVAAGKKANVEMNFPDNTLFENGIVEFTDIEITFDVSDSDDWLAEPVVVETIHVYPYGEERATSFVRKAQPNDNVIIDDENVTVIVTGYEIDEIWGYTANLFFVNKTDVNIMFSTEDVSVNGYMIDPFFAKEVAAGKCAFASMSWGMSTLEENGITDVEEIEFQLSVSDADNWSRKPFVDELITLNP